jgi:hypothetical protein
MARRSSASGRLAPISDSLSFDRPVNLNKRFLLVEHTIGHEIADLNVDSDD